MKQTKFLIAAAVLAMVAGGSAFAQFRTDTTAAPVGDTSKVVLTLEQALEIALNENVAVKVADKEIERAQYARKGTYASLFPSIDLTGSYQRTIKKQVMYMDFDMSDMMPGGGEGEGADAGAGTGADAGASKPSGGGIEVGRWNTFNGGLTASMPLVNAQLWKSIAITGDAVELAVEQARASRLEMVSQVKKAYYGVLLAKEVFNVYKDVYENAVENFGQTEKKYRVNKASELEYIRAKANVANAIPNVYNAESQVILALWQLKAVMGVDLDLNIDVEGSLGDYPVMMMRDLVMGGGADLDNNTTMRQLAIQAEQLAKTVQMQKYAYLPTLGAQFSFSMYAMTNDFNFSEFKWTPYSFVGVSLSIPIFSGGKRYNDVRQAKVQKTELELQRLNTERQLKISIRQSLTTMETNMKSYYAADEAVQMAQKAYDISAKSYNVGKSTLTDLNDAQLALTQAQLQKNQAVYNYLVAKTGLEQTLGYDFLDEEGRPDLQGGFAQTNGK